MLVSTATRKAVLLTVSGSLTTGSYQFSIYSIDSAGNTSPPSAFFTLAVTDGTAKLDFTFENEAYQTGGVSPTIGSSGVYTFKVKYTDFENIGPVISHLWLDLNYDSQYSENEKFSMNRVVSSDNPVATYSTGEIYSLEKHINYNKATKGQLNYLFYFTNDKAAAIDGLSAGDPTTTNTLKLDPYDINSFDGNLQVRNNIYRKTNTRLPTILFKRPANSAEIIDISIYDVKGRLIKTIKHGTVKKEDRFFIWNVTNNSGGLVFKRSLPYTI